MKKRLAFLSLGLVVGLAGVATASALLVTNTEQTVSGGLDAGLILDWGGGADATLPNVENLAYGSAVTQSITVKTPVISSGLEGYATVSFTLGTTGTDASGEQETLAEVSWIDLIKIEISDEAWAPETEADKTLDKTTPNAIFYLDLASFKEDKNFYLRYSLTGEPSGQATASTSLPSLTVQLDYAEEIPGEAGTQEGN